MAGDGTAPLAALYSVAGRLKALALQYPQALDWEAGEGGGQGACNCEQLL